MIDLVPLCLLFLSVKLFRFLIHKELRYVSELSGVMLWDSADKEKSNVYQISSS